MFGRSPAARSRGSLSRYAVTAASALFALAIGLQSAVAQQASSALPSKAPEAAAIAAAAQADGHVRVIVLLNAPNVANQARPNAATIASIKSRVAALQSSVLAHHFGDAVNLRPGRGFVRHHTRFEITPGFVVNVDATELEALAADPAVKSITIDHLKRTKLLQSLPLIGQPTAYTNGATGAGWAVAVLDTGVQANHEFLSGKVVAEACFSNAAGNGGGVSLCPNGLSSQTGAGAADSTTANCINGSINLCQHGTHVAGIAAGFNTSFNSGEPTSGVARDGKIFAIQVFTRFNSAAACSPDPAPCVASFDSDEVLALDYVFQHLTPVAGIGVASVNMSLGGGPNTSSACDGDVQKAAIDNLRAAGVLTAIASGNDGSTTQISHPACISSAVAVGSTTKSDAVSSFSNMATIVALLAPGGLGGGNCSFGGNNPDILSSFAGLSNGTTNLYACEAGTSMATPHVAGAIAAIRTACPSLTADAILNGFKSSGLSVTDTRPGGSITKPRIRLDAALTALGCSPGSGTIAVSPTTDIETAGPQGGPFTPSSFNYTLTASPTSQSYSITGVPTWLTASSTSGTATTSGTPVSFTVNASANALTPGVYTSTITFTDTTSNTTAFTTSAVLVVDDAAVLQVTPSTNMASVGNPGGPFLPSSFQYQLSTNSGTIGYSITGLPAWLDASSTSGTVTTSPTTITFTVNASANSLPIGGYNATIVFANTTNGKGDQTRNAALTVNSGGTAPLAPQTWVSGNGDDANDCTLTAPCQTFAGALSKTAAGGEIACLDAGGFGNVTITKAVSIICRIGAGVLAASTNGVIVDTNGKVLLEGLDIDGLGAGLDGVSIIGPSRVTIYNCSIRNFTQNGVNVTAPAGGRVYIVKSLIANNAVGLNVQGTGGESNFGNLVSTILDSNTTALQVAGAVNKITVLNSALSGNPVAFSEVSGGIIATVGPSDFATGAGAPTSTTAFK